MKVLLVNGSPRPKGNTAALTDALEGILRAAAPLSEASSARRPSPPPSGALSEPHSSQPHGLRDAGPAGV